MNRHERDRLLGKATNNAPSRKDQNVPTTTRLPDADLSAQQARARLDREHALRGLADLGVERRIVERKIAEQVSQCIVSGAVWSEIGASLDVTTQAAWSRYHQIRNPQDSRAASEVLTAGGGISDRTGAQDPELPFG